MKIHWNILDEKRISILPLLAKVAEGGFYLAGGTGLALSLGHRDSIDFDFFIEGDFDVEKLKEKVELIFTGKNIVFTQQEKNTLTFIIDDSIQASFFGYHHHLLLPLIQTEYFPIAEVLDIGCMKLSTIISRSVEKDYVDLYFILKTIPLESLIESFKQKYPTTDISLVLKSLTYFDDILNEPIIFKENHNTPFDTIKDFLKKETLEYITKKR